MRLSPGPEGPTRRRANLLNLALGGALALVFLAARRPRHEVGDLERQPIGPPDLERLDTPPELDER